MHQRALSGSGVHAEHMLSKKRNQKFYNGTVFRTYSEIDLLELQEIKRGLETPKEDMKHGQNYLNIDTILTSYEG